MKVVGGGSTSLFDLNVELCQRLDDGGKVLRLQGTVEQVRQAHAARFWSDVDASQDLLQDVSATSDLVVVGVVFVLSLGL